MIGINNNNLSTVEWVAADRVERLPAAIKSNHIRTLYPKRKEQLLTPTYRHKKNNRNCWNGFMFVKFIVWFLHSGFRWFRKRPSNYQLPMNSLYAIVAFKYAFWANLSCTSCTAISSSTRSTTNVVIVRFVHSENVMIWIQKMYLCFFFLSSYVFNSWEQCHSLANREYVFFSSAARSPWRWRITVATTFFRLICFFFCLLHCRNHIILYIFFLRRHCALGWVFEMHPNEIGARLINVDMTRKK